MQSSRRDELQQAVQIQRGLSDAQKRAAIDARLRYQGLLRSTAAQLTLG